MQLGLHSDRMTVETKNYNVEKRINICIRICTGSDFSDSYAISIIFEKTYIKKKTYQHINFVRPKGCEHRFRKSAEDFFVIFLFFFSHIVIF